MNNFKSCIPCVCTSSGHKQVCERYDSHMGPPSPPPEYYGIELERLTDKQVSKNITFPQTMYAGGNKETEI